VAPSPAKAGLNQGSDVPPPSAGGESNQVSEEAPSTVVQTTFKWRIDGFSSLLEKGKGWTYSNVFQIRGLKWYNYYQAISFQASAIFIGELDAYSVMNKILFNFLFLYSPILSD
jgi:hypothetical protein